MDLCGPIPLGLRVLHNQTASGRPGHGACLGQENTASNNTPTFGFEQHPDPSESRLPPSGAACEPLADQGQVLQQASVLDAEPALRDASLSTCSAYHSDEQARSTSGGLPLCVTPSAPPHLFTSPQYMPPSDCGSREAPHFPSAHTLPRPLR